MSISEFSWSDYQSFLTVSSLALVAVYQKAARRMYGEMGDFCCGPAKILPYLSGEVVSRYVGIDSSAKMIALGGHVMNRVLAREAEIKVELICENIKDYCAAEKLDSAVCINALYAWENRDQCILSIASNLKPGATLVLATPNNKLDMQALLDNAKEVWFHPDFENFSKINLALANNSGAFFPSLDQLVDLLNPYFSLQYATAEYFLGGLNYLELTRRR